LQGFFAAVARWTGKTPLMQKNLSPEEWDRVQRQAKAEGTKGKGGESTLMVALDGRTKGRKVNHLSSPFFTNFS